MFSFEGLDVWNEAIDFAGEVYAVTKTFPDTEKFGLVTQLRRAAVSISANIAEGSSRWSPNEQLRFVEIAMGSTFEVVSLARIAANQHFLTDPQYRSIYTTAELIGRMLSGLRSYHQNRAA